MSDINEVHNECDNLPVDLHSEAEMLTLNDTYRDRSKQHTNNKQQLNCKEYKNALKSIHRHTFHTQLNKDSKQLGNPPSKIAEGEQTLPRIARIRLAQLRTRYYPLLNSYLSKICDHADNRCPKWDVAPHEVNHISTAPVRTPRT